MALGEAFIEVNADLRPFARDLRRNVRPIAAAFEKEINGAVKATLRDSEETGRRIGERTGRGMKQGLNDKFRNKNFFVLLASSLASALDDGISALPTEVKAAIVAGIIASLPILGAMLTGAITSAIAVGIVGLGIALGSQFEQVQQEAVKFGRDVRTILVNSAQAFGPAIISALALIKSRILALSDTFKELFDKAATFVVPLTNGVLDAVESVVQALADVTVSGDLDGFVRELADGFRFLGEIVAEVIRQLARTGKDGQSGLRDLFRLAGALVGAFGGLLVILTRVMSALKQIAVLLGKIIPWVGVMQFFANKLLTGGLQEGTTSTTESNFKLEDSFNGLISATDGETQALEDYKKGLQTASDAVRNNLEMNIDWEESLDRISKSLKENGKNLDIGTEKGRENVKEFLHGLEIAEQRAIQRVKTGEMTSDQAAAQYQKEIDQLHVLAREAGISDQKFNELFGQIIDVAALNISAQDMGVTDLSGELGDADAQAKALLATLLAIKKLALNIAIGGIGGAKAFADGDIVTKPTFGIFGENGPEVVVPLTKPARAAQLLEQSGLSSMLSGGPTQVLVFVGNEQLDSRMVRIVERNNNAQTLALTHGGRS
jgi:hypothetical protein